MTRSVRGPTTPRKEEDLTLRIPTQPGCALAPQGHSLCLWCFLATDKNLLDEHRKAGRFIQRCFWCRTNPGRQSGAHRCLGQSPSSFSCSIISQAVTRDADLRWAGEAQETVTPAEEGSMVSGPCLVSHLSFSSFRWQLGRRRENCMDCGMAEVRVYQLLFAAGSETILGHQLRGRAVESSDLEH